MVATETALDCEEPLSESLEDYMEAILHITEAKVAAKPRDISRAMGVNNSSVTGALRVLAKRGLVNYAPFEVITLTAHGKTAAQGVARRHQALSSFLVKVLAVEEGEADEAACKMEHAIPPHIVDRLAQFARFIEACPQGGERWLAEFRDSVLKRRKKGV